MSRRIGRQWVWHFDAKGLTSVKSAYKVALANRDASVRCDASGSHVPGSRSEFEWHKIWQLKVGNKVSGGDEKCGKACDYSGQEKCLVRFMGVSF
jgi:hypothetical protein